MNIIIKVEILTFAKIVIKRLFYIGKKPAIRITTLNDI